jgi:nitrate/nitrite transport system ATP-binding protein
VHKHPQYYRLRNHIVDFLVERSRRFDAEIAGKVYDPRRPPEIRPGLEPDPVREASPHGPIPQALRAVT